MRNLTLYSVRCTTSCATLASGENLIAEGTPHYAPEDRVLGGIAVIFRAFRPVYQISPPGNFVCRYHLRNIGYPFESLRRSFSVHLLAAINNIVYVRTN